MDKVQSGYVHGASPHLMEMVGGNPPRFHMNGMPGTPGERSHREEFWRYLHRSIMLFSTVAYSFVPVADAAKIRAYADWFERSKPGGEVSSRDRSVPRGRDLS